MKLAITMISWLLYHYHDILAAIPTQHMLERVYHKKLINPLPGSDGGYTIMITVISWPWLDMELTNPETHATTIKTHGWTKHETHVTTIIQSLPNY